MLGELIASSALLMPPDHTPCAESFLASVDEGSIQTINGLAVATDFSAYYVTEWRPQGPEQRARIARFDCDRSTGLWARSQTWTTPTAHSDYQPVLSLDGQTLLFTSTAPPSGELEAIRQNPWRLELDSGTASPLFIRRDRWDGHAVEIEPGLFLVASEAEDGNVDFHQVRLPAAGPGPTVEALNTADTEGDASYAQANRLLLFTRYSAAAEDLDIFWSCYCSVGDWSPPRRLDALSTGQWEQSPILVSTGEELHLLFTRGGPTVYRQPLPGNVSCAPSSP